MAADLAKVLEDMRAGREIHFADLKKVCEAYFGAPRTSGSSHFVFKTPWPFDPRVNIQDEKGKAKAYQVRQVVKAIDKLIEIRAAAAKGKPPKKK